MTLTDAGGATLESGAGSTRRGTDVRIAVQATDRPGGVGRAEAGETV